MHGDDNPKVEKGFFLDKFKKEDKNRLTAENCLIKSNQSFGMYNTLIYKNMDFIDEGK
jgi:hypothetical protein